MLRTLLLLLLAFGAAGAAAAQSNAGLVDPGAVPPNPYSATVPVAGTHDDQRSAAMSAALAEILAQASSGLTATPEQLAQASGYVRNYHYRRAASGGLELEVQFDPGAIRRVIADARSAAAGAVAGQPTSGGTSAGTVAGTSGGPGTVWVSGVDNVHAFASLLSLLRASPALHEVVPVGADGDGVLLRVNSERPLGRVLGELGGPLGHLSPAGHAHPGADATMRWTP